MDRISALKQMLKEGIPVFLILGVYAINIVLLIVWTNSIHGSVWLSIPTSIAAVWSLGIGVMAASIEIAIFFAAILPIINRWSELRRK